MIAFGGKRSEESARVMDQIRSREWGLLLMDEVHVVPAQMFRKVCMPPHIPLHPSGYRTMLVAPLGIPQHHESLQASNNISSALSYKATVRARETATATAVATTSTTPETSPSHGAVRLGASALPKAQPLPAVD